MKAIVTGGEGFIGNALVRRLLSDNWEVVSIDDMSNHSKKVRADYLYHIKLKDVYARVQDVGNRLTMNANAIFHLSGKVGPVGVLPWKGRIAGDTLEAAETVKGWASLWRCPVIFASTSEIYGNEDGPNSEDDPKVFPNPPSARMEYAVSKLAAETMLLNSNIDARVIRPFNVAGPGQRIDGGFVLPRFVRQALDNEALTVYTPGTQLRSFTHVDDIVDGFIAMYHMGKPGYVVNLGNRLNACSILQLAEEVIATVGSGHIEIVDPTSIHGPDFKEAKDKIPDTTRAWELLAWRPERSRQDIIDDTVRYWSERK